MAQVAAEVLSIPTEKIRVETPDTDRNPYEWQTVASHVTWGCGNAVYRAAEDAREQIFDLVERALGKQRDALYLENECVKSHIEPDFCLPLKDFIINGIQKEGGTFRGGPVVGRGMFMPEYTNRTCIIRSGQAPSRLKLTSRLVRCAFRKPCSRSIAVKQSIPIW
jgi:carbon-monoxide dehydrogenase large subunit